MKGKSAKADNCTVRNQDFTDGEVRIATKDGLPKSMQDELDDHPEDYFSLNYEYWCDLLSTSEGKNERKREAANIKNIASAMAASLYDSYKSARIPRKKKARTGVLRSNKPQKKAHKHHGIQRYCVLYKKAGMPEKKYMQNSAEDCTGVRTNQTIKDGMGGSVEISTDNVKQYKKSEKMDEGYESLQEEEQDALQHRQEIWLAP